MSKSTRIKVEKWKKDEKERPKTFRKVFIYKIPSSIQDEAQFRALFSRFGTIERVTIAKFRDGSRNGYCDFSNHFEADNAIKQLNGTMINGEILNVEIRLFKKDLTEKKAKRKNLEKNQSKFIECKNRNLYVKGFGSDMTEKEFQNIFSKYGEIESSVIIKNTKPSYDTKKYGFICFKTEESANKCIFESVYPGLFLDGRLIFIAKALNPDERAAFKQKQSQMTQLICYDFNIEHNEKFHQDMLEFLPKVIVQDKIDKLHDLKLSISLEVLLSQLSDNQVSVLAKDPVLLESWISLFKK